MTKVTSAKKHCKAEITLKTSENILNAPESKHPNVPRRLKKNTELMLLNGTEISAGIS